MSKRVGVSQALKHLHALKYSHMLATIIPDGQQRDH